MGLDTCHSRLSGCRADTRTNNSVRLNEIFLHYPGKVYVKSLLNMIHAWEYVLVLHIYISYIAYNTKYIKFKRQKPFTLLFIGTRLNILTLLTVEHSNQDSTIDTDRQY